MNTVVLGNVRNALSYSARLLLIALLCSAAFVFVAEPATASAAASYKWSQRSVTWVTGQDLMPAAMLGKGLSAKVTRRAWVQSLEALENYRAAHGGSAAQLPTVTTGTSLTDVTADTIYAKAVYLGWITPMNGAFNGSAAINADEASKGIVAVLGLRDSAMVFSLALQANMPKASVPYYYKATQVYARALDLRYNHLQGTEVLEVGPKEAMSVAHVAFMIHHASVITSWRLDSVHEYEDFDIPDLGPNQKKIIYTGLRFIGWPYIWGGETDGKQPEGHGGFDCSGFVWRVTLNSGVKQKYRTKVSGRTSMAMSGEYKKRKRLYKVANLRPGDMLFFGYRGAASKPAENYHMGTYLGNMWFIHSTGSNDGVSIDRLDGYWLDNFSWGRHVLKRR